MEKDPQKDLFEEHMELAEYVARSYVSTTPLMVEYDDILQLAFLGLLDAIKLFDPSYKVKFKTYAQYRIRGYIIDSLRTEDWVPRFTRKRASIVRKHSEVFAADNNRLPTETELRACLAHYERSEVDLIIADSSPPETLQAFAPVSDKWDDQRELNLIDQYEDKRRQLDEVEAKDLVHVALGDLSKQQRDVLEFYYLHGATMREIAMVMRVTESRICQIHRQAFPLFIQRVSVRLRRNFDLTENDVERIKEVLKEEEDEQEMIDVQGLVEGYKNLGSSDKHVVRSCYEYLKKSPAPALQSPPLTTSQEEMDQANQHVVDECTEYMEGRPVKQEAPAEEETPEPVEVGKPLDEPEDELEDMSEAFKKAYNLNLQLF